MNVTRRGRDADAWMETFTGRKFYPLDPDPADVCIEDIAHALAMKCRFTGHSRFFYSVAEHSVLMAEYCEREGQNSDALFALLHDATEAYLPDVARPVKHHLPWWPEIEARVHRAIAQAFGLAEENERVKVIDNRILLAEAQVLMHSRAENWIEWEQGLEPLPVEVYGMSPSLAAARFLCTFERLS